MRKNQNKLGKKGIWLCGLFMALAHECLGADKPFFSEYGDTSMVSSLRAMSSEQRNLRLNMFYKQVEKEIEMAFQPAEDNVRWFITKYESNLHEAILQEKIKLCQEQLTCYKEILEKVNQWNKYIKEIQGKGLTNTLLHTLTNPQYHLVSIEKFMNGDIEYKDRCNKQNSVYNPIGTSHVHNGVVFQIQSKTIREFGNNSNNGSRETVTLGFKGINSIMQEILSLPDDYLSNQDVNF